MKGNISRDSHRPEARYSGVFQVQGGMVTDADLGEQARIARRRADALGHDTAGCGVPVEGGTVVITGGNASLAEGTVYAEGVRGKTSATGPLANALSLYDLQVDFPLAPAMPAAGDLIVYADLWERMVSNLEDPLLSDPGLHGAETAFRARTMAQIKVAPAAQEASLGDAEGPNPRIGGGVLSVTPVDPDTIADDCDPCADTVTAEQTVANGLFRLEVLHVFGDPQSPDRIVIAWSAENASAIAPATVNSEDFSRAGAVYEFFSYATETHLGVHADNGAVARSSFATSLAAGPVVPAAPEGGDWPFVRRWDGAVEIDTGAGTVDRVGGGGGVAISGQTFTLTVDAFTAEIEFAGEPVVAGDYWLIETRRFAETPIRMVQEKPIGILHNYCQLFRVSGGAVIALSDQEVRRLSFPTLADIPATHVGFENNCPKLYEDAENVQEALDNLCAIDASDIAFDPSDCTRLFDSTDNVQDALINLCKVDFGNERLLRLLHDWGVICGVIPTRIDEGTAGVHISAGAILDRAGRLGEVREMKLDLSSLVGTRFFHFDSMDEFDALLRKKQVCLALAIDEGGEVRPHLATKKRAFGPSDPTFLTVFADCRKKNPPFDPKDDFTTLPEKNRVTLDKVVYGAASPKLAASQRLDAEEQLIARKYNDDLVNRYKKHVDDDAEAALIDLRIREVDAETDADGTAGEVRETRLMQREAAVYQLVQVQDVERLRRCLCNALLPRCPEIGEPPHLVPIACIEGVTEGKQIFLRDICVAACRKQAMSWRMVQYYIAEMRDRVADSVQKLCCPPEEDDGPVIGKAPPDGKIALAALEKQLKPDAIGLQAETSLNILTGRNPPSDYMIRPDVTDLGIDTAKVALAGNGVEVAETINVNDADAVRKIRDISVGIDGRDLVLDDGAVAPGDKVALIVQDGVTTGYIKIETGGGKFIFDRSKPAGGKDVPGLEDTKTAVEKLEERIRKADEAAESTDKETAARQKMRQEEIARETAEVGKDLEAIRTERKELGSQVEGLSEKLSEIKGEREAALGEIDEARAELEKLKEEQTAVLKETRNERDTLVISIRRETPVSAVIGEEKEFMSRLARRGVTSIGGLAELPEDTLREVAREAGLNLNSARRLQREAENRLSAPIR